MRHNILLDTTLTGSPFHCLRALAWNVRTLGLGWWARCQAENLLIIASDLAGHVMSVWQQERHRRVIRIRI